jgi:ankyrin repeat protein
VTPTGCSYHPLAIAAASGNLRVVQMLLEAGADVRETSEFGWTALHSSVGADATTRWFRGPEGARRVDVGGSAFKCAAALIAAGADVNAASRQGTTPLLVVARILPSHMSTPLLAVLLRAGATLDPRVRSWSPYLEKVHDAGGWERYAQAHRKHLAAMFASKLGLPSDVFSLVVDFWGAHVGMYAFDAGATKEVENVENGRKSGPCTIS